MRSVDMLQSPFDSSQLDGPPSVTQSAHDQRDQEGDYDWATFISAYAMGRWDPLRTPNPPRSYLNILTHSRTARSGSASILERPLEDICASPDQEPAEAQSHVLGRLATVFSGNPPGIHTELDTSGMSSVDDPQDVFRVPPSVPSAQTTPPAPQPNASRPRRLNVPFNLGAFPHRFRGSFTDVRASNAGSGDHSREPSIPTTEAATTAAAMRWAAARVSVAPLALPSPEHELTDPMRGVTATIPGSHPSGPPYLNQPAPPPLYSPGTLRKSRLSSFWQGTQDIEDGRLPTIEQSPPETGESAVSSSPDIHETEPAISVKRSEGTDGRYSSIPIIGANIPPATAPVKVNTQETEEDYFGSVEPTRVEALVQAGEPPFPLNVIVDHHPERQVSAPPFDSNPQTVPALPRRICLTRQTSAPLPVQSLYERRMRSARPASESYVSSLTGRAAKEEQMYSELGYLVPPNPPDELERRRALYKYVVQSGWPLCLTDARMLYSGLTSGVPDTISISIVLCIW